jgi:hypothetical protein
MPDLRDIKSVDKPLTSVCFFETADFWEPFAAIRVSLSEAEKAGI